MSKTKPIEQRIKSVATAVKAIENMRGKLFTKMLPELYKQRYARTIFNAPAIWCVVTQNQDYLERIERIALDNLSDLGQHVKFYDAEGSEMIPVPEDIIAIFTLNPTNKGELPEEESDEIEG